MTSSTQFSSQFGIFAPIGAWDVSAPSAPATISAVGGNKQVVVTFASSTGATSYTLYWRTLPGVTPSTGTRISGITSPYTHSGLQNGTTYYYIVVATSANGDSTPSSQASATTLAVPDAPTIGTATAGVSQATVAFTANSPGGSAITGFTATSDTGGHSATGASSPLTVTGLTNGTSYTFTVIATNAQGDSLPSDRSNRITPATVPDAPTIGTATAGDTTASVAFTPPAFNGGAAITGYTATSTPSSITGTGSGSPITVSGLLNGTAYTFTVHATNSVGNSAESAASNSVTPTLTPTPTKVLLHFDGANGATTTTDAYGNSVALTSATLATAQTKFGTASLGCLNNNNYFATVTGLSAAAAGWTMECFIYNPNVGATWRGTPFQVGNASFFGARIILSDNGSTVSQLAPQISTNGTSWNYNPGATTTSPYMSKNAWHHMAMVFDASTNHVYTYVDGVKVNDVTIVGNMCSINKLLVGADSSGNAVNAYIDEFRWDSTTCKYPGGTTFTPPSSAFIS